MSQNNNNHNHAPDLRLWQALIICGVALLACSLTAQWHIDGIGIILIVAGLFAGIGSTTPQAPPRPSVRVARSRETRGTPRPFPPLPPRERR